MEIINSYTMPRIRHPFFLQTVDSCEKRVKSTLWAAGTENPKSPPSQTDLNCTSAKPDWVKILRIIVLSLRAVTYPVLKHSELCFTAPSNLWLKFCINVILYVLYGLCKNPLLFCFCYRDIFYWYWFVFLNLGIK